MGTDPRSSVRAMSATEPFLQPYLIFMLEEHFIVGCKMLSWKVDIFSLELKKSLTFNNNEKPVSF